MAEHLPGVIQVLHVLLPDYAEIINRVYLLEAPFLKGLFLLKIFSMLMKICNTLMSSVIILLPCFPGSLFWAVYC